MGGAAGRKVRGSRAARRRDEGDEPATRIVRFRMTPSQKCAEIHVSAGRLSSGGPIQGVIQTPGLMRLSVASRAVRGHRRIRRRRLLPRPPNVCRWEVDVGRRRRGVHAGPCEPCRDLHRRAAIPLVRAGAPVRVSAGRTRGGVRPDLQAGPDFVAPVEPSGSSPTLSGSTPRTARDAESLHPPDAEARRRRVGPSTADLPTEAEALTTIRRCQVNDADLEIFMTVGAAQAEFDAAAAAVVAPFPGRSVKRVLSSEDGTRSSVASSARIGTWRTRSGPPTSRGPSVHADPDFLHRRADCRLQALPRVEEAGDAAGGPRLDPGTAGRAPHPRAPGPLDGCVRGRTPDLNGPRAGKSVRFV